MSPPIWEDDDGRRSQVLPCPRCGRGVPLRRRSASTLRILRWHPYQVLSVVNWCGHALETIIMPEDAGGEWYAEVPVLGEAT